MGRKFVLSIFLIFALIFTLTACNGQKEEANLNSESVDISDVVDEDVVDDVVEQSLQEISPENLQINSQENEVNLQNKPEIQNKSQDQELKNQKSEIKNTNNVLNKQSKKGNSITQKPIISQSVPKPCQHNYIEVARSAPNCTSAGTRTLRCSNCGITYSEGLSPLGHSLGGWDCDDIKHFRKCARCGMIESAKHTLHDEECTVCGKVIFAD